MTYWVGLDGEGIGRDPHRYVMMAWSDADGDCNYIENMSGLSTEQCLNFILDTPQNSRVCGYYLGYDWTKILKDLPDNAIYRLLRPELRAIPPDEGGGFSRVPYKQYRLHFLSGMMRISDGKRKRTVWDIGKYYQAPFVDALEAWDVVAPLTDIRAMKDKRSEFTDHDRPQVRAYCLSECKALAQLATRLEDAHIDVGISPRSWHGPGSTATALMRTLGIKEKLGNAPAEVEIAADYAFFGGRFEHSTIGQFDDVWGFDIVSAYPYQAYNLPCLVHGRWRRTTRRNAIDSATHACVRYRVRDIGHKEVWGPLPCRLSNGTIVFARGGFSGWAWREEYLAAEANWDGIEFIEAWILKSECDCHPFAELLRLFRFRIQFGKDGRGRILKLAYNSVYGKLAQTIGFPQFASRIWSGMITSGTRAQLLTLLAKHVDRRNVLALATDGLYSTERVAIPADPLSPDTLGAWESKGPDTITLVRPGIYWSESPKVARARGLSRKLVSIDTKDEKRKARVMAQRAAVLDAIESDDESVEVGTSELFGGARAGVYRLRNGEVKRSRHYGEWREIPAKVSLDPGPKRRPDWGLHMLPNVESIAYTRAKLSDDARVLKAVGDMFWGMRG